MEMSYFLLIMIGGFVFLTVISTDENDPICYNEYTGQNDCCKDYKNISGTCEACIGSWGKNCKNNCSSGFYGHGCRKQCNCNTNEICDSRQRCVETHKISATTASLCRKRAVFLSSTIDAYYISENYCCVDFETGSVLPLFENFTFITNVYYTLTSTYGINVCYNSTTGTAVCCQGFTNRTGICERKNGELNGYSENTPYPSPSSDVKTTLTEEMCAKISEGRGVGSGNFS